MHKYISFDYLVILIAIIIRKMMIIKRLGGKVATPNKMFSLGQYQFSVHHGPTPSKLQKVQSKFIYFNVKSPRGYWQKIPAIVGQSVLDSIMRMSVKGFPTNICQGGDMVYRPHERPHDPFSDGPSCGNCRIVLRDNWYEKVMEQTDGMTIEEEKLLHVELDLRSQTRLACCVPVENFMDGMTFQIEPASSLSNTTDVI